MPIPGSPGIPYDWEIVIANCDELSKYAHNVVDAAANFLRIANDPTRSRADRTGARIAVMLLSKKYDLISFMWTKVKGCGDASDLPPYPGVIAEETWPPKFPG